MHITSRRYAIIIWSVPQQSETCSATQRQGLESPLALPFHTRPLRSANQSNSHKDIGLAQGEMIWLIQPQLSVWYSIWLVQVFTCVHPVTSSNKGSLHCAFVSGMGGRHAQMPYTCCNRNCLVDVTAAVTLLRLVQVFTCVHPVTSSNKGSLHCAFVSGMGGRHAQMPYTCCNRNCLVDVTADVTLLFDHAWCRSSPACTLLLQATRAACTVRLWVGLGGRHAQMPYTCLNRNCLVDVTAAVTLLFDQAWCKSSPACTLLLQALIRAATMVKPLWPIVVLNNPFRA